MSVITSHTYIAIDEASSIQEDKTYITSNWLFDMPSDKQAELFLETSEDQNSYFRSTRNAFIEERIKTVSDEQEMNEKVVDFVDEIINISKSKGKENICLWSTQ